MPAERTKTEGGRSAALDGADVSRSRGEGLVYAEARKVIDASFCQPLLVCLASEAVQSAAPLCHIPELSPKFRVVLRAPSKEPFEPSATRTPVWRHCRFTDGAVG